MKTFIAFRNILLKDMKNYYLKPPNISWGIIFPFAWMLMMFIKSGAVFDISNVFPGVVAMSILFGKTSIISTLSGLFIAVTGKKKKRCRFYKSTF